MKAEISKQLQKAATKTTISVWFLISLVLTITGPFGSIESLNFWERLAYWSVLVGGSIPVAYFSRGIGEAFLSDRSLLVRDAGFLTLFSVLFTPFSTVLTSFRFSDTQHVAPTLLEMFGYVFFATLVVNIFRRQLMDLDEESYFSAPQPVQLPRLHQRLPGCFSGPVLRLTARDHIVEVVNADTTVEVRMRFLDAIAEMDGVIGYCAHRSHWVSAAAIVGTVRDGGKIKLRLGNGDTVPVSRKYRPVLEEAGIL